MLTAVSMQERSNLPRVSDDSRAQFTWDGAKAGGKAQSTSVTSVTTSVTTGASERAEQNDGRGGIRSFFTRGFGKGHMNEETMSNSVENFHGGGAWAEGHNSQQLSQVSQQQAQLSIPQLRRSSSFWSQTAPVVKVYDNYAATV